MAECTGTQFINLKKAKYNRDRKMNIHNAVIENGYDSSVCVKSSRTREVYGDGLTFKDVIGLATDALSKAIYAKRKQLARERANTPTYVEKRVKETRAFPISLIGYIIVFSAIAVFLIYGNSKINEATLEVGRLENEITNQLAIGETLDVYLNARNDAQKVENYAVNILGMVKSTDVAKTYVSISGEDKVVVCSNR